MPKEIQELAMRDGRYSPDAFRFLFESLNHAVRAAGKEHAQGTDRHVSGQELLEGMRLNALELFGPLAAQVWRSWGVHDSMDWGRIVFLLVDHELLNRQDSDTIDDFQQGFDFDEAFVRSYRPNVPSSLDGSGPIPEGVEGPGGPGEDA